MEDRRGRGRDEPGRDDGPGSGRNAPGQADTHTVARLAVVEGRHTADELVVVSRREYFAEEVAEQPDTLLVLDGESIAAEAANQEEADAFIEGWRALEEAPPPDPPDGGEGGVQSRRGKDDEEEPARRGEPGR